VIWTPARTTIHHVLPPDVATWNDRVHPLDNHGIPGNAGPLRRGANLAFDGKFSTPMRTRLVSFIVVHIHAPEISSALGVAAILPALQIPPPVLALQDADGGESPGRHVA
jgi:hypothetical protein